MTRSTRVTTTRANSSSIGPTENIGVALFAIGEGWHNYHHVFPWDYKAAEFGNYRTNLTTAFIDFFARIGWAYNMKTVPTEAVKKRAERTGDGSRYEYDGYGDPERSRFLEPTKLERITNRMESKCIANK